MGAESSAAIIRLPRRTRGTFVPRNFAPENLSKFGKVCMALWPDKTGLNLSQRVGCSERHANLLIAGERKPNAHVAHVVFGEIIS